MYQYTINKDDAPVVKHFIKEANEMLASSTGELEKIYIDKFDRAIHILENICDMNISQIKSLFDFINNYLDLGSFSDLKLSDEYFDKDTHIFNRFVHKRPYGFIFENAYNVLIRAEYNHNLCKQTSERKELINDNLPIYISKGGVITGEHFHTIYIKDKDIFSPKKFTIPVSAIEYETENNSYSFLVVDHREPQFKALVDYYDVSIKVDEEVKNIKLNLRKYKKIKHEGNR